MKKAIIFGITGQDGSYLAELLLQKGYIVHGVIRRSSTFNTSRLDHIYQEPFKKDRNFILHYGDVTDSLSVSRIVKDIQPDEIYNLAAQSHVAVSFEIPEYTANADAIGPLRILEAIKFHGLKTKFYQACTSEMYGSSPSPQNENTPMHPASPYGVAKLYAYWITKNYRDAYGIFACNGILFNHESPRRGETFVTKKIVTALTKIKNTEPKILYLGNLNAKRDWGHAKDYVEALWVMLQPDTPDDFVIATGKQYSIKDFVNMTADELDMDITWKVGEDGEERGYYKNKAVVQCSQKYIRPLDVNTLMGDATKAKQILKWEPKHDIKSLIKDMINNA